MNKQKLFISLGAALIAIGLFLGFTLSYGIGAAGKEKAMLTDSVYLEDNKYNPENNGKVVILSGLFDMSVQAYDPDIVYTFESPVVQRNVEIYKNVGTEESPKMEWTLNYEPNDVTKLTTTVLYGKVQLGDFFITGTPLFQMSNNVPFTNFMRVSADARNYALETKEGQPQYLTQAPDVTNEDNLLIQENKHRVSYYYYDMSIATPKTVIGVQQGNTIVSTEDFQTKVLDGNYTTKEEAIAACETKAPATITLGWMIALAGIIGGIILLMITLGKNKPKA